AMESLVSTYSRVCDPLGVCLRDRNMCLMAASRAASTSRATVSLISSSAEISGGWFCGAARSGASLGCAQMMAAHPANRPPHHPAAAGLLLSCVEGIPLLSVTIALTQMHLTLSSVSSRPAGTHLPLPRACRVGYSRLSGAAVPVPAFPPVFGGTASAS